jgi:chloramphenicol-sensitive protein RarD
VALAYVGWAQVDGSAVFGHEGPLNMLLLAGAGVITAVPLLLFGGAATRVPMSTLGLLQYIAPTMHFVLGLVFFGEAMSPARWVGFVLVWIALVMLTTESLVSRRRLLPGRLPAEPATS